MTLVSPYQTNRVGDPMNLVALAQQVQKVSDALDHTCDIQFYHLLMIDFFCGNFREMNLSEPMLATN